MMVDDTQPPVARKTYTPRGTHFYDLASGRVMLLVDDDEPEWGGWLCFKHPDGQWVSERRATGFDRAKVAAEIARRDARLRAQVEAWSSTMTTPPTGGA